jgi:peptide/nickel transport system substrate-binding protein
MRRIIARVAGGALALAGVLAFPLAALAYQEAPILAEQVAAGALPPVDERLPAEPLVLELREGVGTYGGDLTFGIKGMADWVLLQRTMGYEPLVTWNPEWDEIVPNIAKAFHVNEDATEFVFELREGMKWSDGHPFTADDIVFWFEDILLDPDISPGIPAGMRAGGEPPVLTKVDDLTVKFAFEESNGLFLQYVAYGRGGFEMTSFPRHYFEQFHLKYNENADELATELGFSNWLDMFQDRSGDYMAPWRFRGDVPVVLPWMLQSGLETLAGGQQVVAVRNPYYFKVDPEGNQLPYIDRAVYASVQDDEVLLLKALNGEIDFQDRNVGIDANRAVLYDGQEAGGYRFYEVALSDMNTGIISINQTIPDERKREIFTNKDFRIALSHAINRQEIIDIVHQGVGEPWQAAPRPDTPLYNERLAKQYTEYDPDLANQMLDAILPDRGANGMRTYADGTPFTFVLEASDAHGLRFPDAAELVVRYWQEVGIDAQVRVMDRALLDQRRVGNVQDAMIWRGFGGSLDAIVDTRWYVPVNGNSNFGIPWSQWAEGEAGGIEPPQAVKDHMAMYRQVALTPTLEGQIEKYGELLEVSADQFYVIGISLRGPGFGIVKTDLGNAPQVVPAGGDILDPAHSRLEQLFWKN